ncbi:MAG: hypothetical protein LBQ24_06700 [Candidatus Peribacteria bacterium]|nr:hypothetical protein [Candidatus Peribacteria bacterium]
MVFSRIYFNNSLNFEPFISFVFWLHQAHKFTQVKTTSFHQFFSNSNILFTISSLSLEKCLHLFRTVKQKEQKLSHHH